MQTHPSNQTTQRLLRLPEVESRVGLRKSAIYAMMRETPPTFPLAVKLSRRAVCWASKDIDAWIAERIQLGAQ